MKTYQDEIPDWDFSDSDSAWRIEPSDNMGIELPAPQMGKFNLRGTCGRIFACACGTGGGFLAGHAGCVASYAATFTSIGLSGGFSASGLAVGASAAIAATGAGIWYGLRGKLAGAWEKALTLGGAASGVGIALSLHVAATDGHVRMAEEALEYYHSMTPEQQETFRMMPPLLEKLCRSPAPENAPK